MTSNNMRSSINNNNVVVLNDEEDDDNDNNVDDEESNDEAEEYDKERVPDATTHITNTTSTNTTTITNTTNPFTTTTMPLRESSRIRHPTNFFHNTQEQPNNNNNKISNNSSKKRKGVPNTNHSRDEGSDDEDEDLHQDFPLSKVVKERENSSVRTNDTNSCSIICHCYFFLDRLWSK